MRGIFRTLQLIKLRVRGPVGFILFLIMAGLAIGQFCNGVKYIHTEHCSEIIRIDYNPSTQYTDSYYRLSLSNGEFVKVSKIGRCEVGGRYHQRFREALGRKSPENDRIVIIVCSLISLFLIWLLLFPIAIIIVNGKLLTVKQVKIDNESWASDVEYLSILRVSQPSKEIYKTVNFGRFYTWSETNTSLNECYEFIKSISNPSKNFKNEKIKI